MNTEKILYSDKFSWLNVKSALEIKNLNQQVSFVNIMLDGSMGQKLVNLLFTKN